MPSIYSHAKYTIDCFYQFAFPTVFVEYETKRLFLIPHASPSFYLIKLLFHGSIKPAL